MMSPEEVKRAYKPAIRPIEWLGGKLRILDQSKLPFETTFIDLDTVDGVADAIRSMKVRGAPAIGITAAYGMAIALVERESTSMEVALRTLEEAYRKLAATRPTAVNLFWALDRVMGVARSIASKGDVSALRGAVEAEANRIFEEELDAEISMGLHGISLIQGGDSIMTQCNAGGLATGTGLGTALAPIKLAKFMGMDVQVIIPETRPWLQGARLTAYEMAVEGVRSVLITDTAVGLVMYEGMVDMVMVGADRILLDGHVFNKIGTYKQAVIARELGIPFYVLAPTSTIDVKSAVQDVRIEERDPDEVRYVKGSGGRVLITLPDVTVYNPVFDVTPPKYVTAVVTERGIAYQPLDRNIPRLLGR